MNLLNRLPIMPMLQVVKQGGYSSCPVLFIQIQYQSDGAHPDDD